MLDLALLPLLPRTASLLAALPFLPAGRGALILILGGLVVVPVALLLSRSSVLGHRWVVGLAARAEGRGLGPCRLVAATASNCVVRVGECATCRAQGGGKAGACRREARELTEAARERAPAARAVEVACNHLGDGACTFIVHRGTA